MKKWFALCMMFVIAYLIVNNPLTMEYISSTKGDTVTVVKQTDLLYHEIEKKANEYHIPAMMLKLIPFGKQFLDIMG